MKLSRKMTTRLSQSCYEKLEVYALHNDVSVGVAVRELLEKFLDIIDNKQRDLTIELVDSEV